MSQTIMLSQTDKYCSELYSHESTQRRISVEHSIATETAVRAVKYGKSAGVDNTLANINQAEAMAP